MYRYKMKVILTESQYRKLLKENFDQKVSGSLSKMHEFSKKVVSDASMQLRFDFRFLVTYGAGIGAILQSVFEYLEGNFNGLDDTQIAGLAVMAVGVVFYENKDLRKPESIINSLGLDKELETAVSFTNKLKLKFAHLLKLLGMSIHRVSNIISYSFLIPILSIVIEVVTTHGINSTQFQTLLESLITSGLIAVEGVALRDILIKAAEMIEKKGINQN
jgi:hypothetical protein